jgi:death-on-curing protein
VKAPDWIDERDALALHDSLLALHGGAVGLRDDGLLKSALARPRQHSACAESPDIVDMAAAYAWGIVRNHPFIDGNKRTGFVVGIVFLELNGYRFSASEEDAAKAVLELASANLDEAGYVAFLRANSSQLKSGGSNAIRHRKC